MGLPSDGVVSSEMRFRHSPRYNSLPVGPRLAGLPVLIDRDGLDAGSHACGVEQAVEVIDLVVDQAGEAAFVGGGGHLAVQGGGLHGDLQRPGDRAANVEERQAALELLVRLVGVVGDPRVQQDDRRAVRVGGLDDGGPADADLRCRNARALGERVDLAELIAPRMGRCAVEERIWPSVVPLAVPWIGCEGLVRELVDAPVQVEPLCCPPVRLGGQREDGRGVGKLKADGEAGEVGEVVAEGGEFPVEQEAGAVGLADEVAGLQVVVEEARLDVGREGVESSRPTSTRTVPSPGGPPAGREVPNWWRPRCGARTRRQSLMRTTRPWPKP